MCLEFDSQRNASNVINIFLSIRSPPLLKGANQEKNHSKSKLSADHLNKFFFHQ